MINPSVPPFPAQPVSWSGVARLCRRICLLRECGRNDEAEHWRRTALAEAIAELRVADDSAAIEQRLDAIFAAEAERVANAAVLAELLAPLIAKNIPNADALGPVAADLGRQSPTAPIVAEAPPHRPATEPALSAGDPTGIAHFIDEMLGLEQRPPPAPARRAS